MDPLFAMVFMDSQTMSNKVFIYESHNPLFNWLPNCLKAFELRLSSIGLSKLFHHL